MKTYKHLGYCIPLLLLALLGASCDSGPEYEITLKFDLTRLSPEQLRSVDYVQYEHKRIYPDGRKDRDGSDFGSATRIWPTHEEGSQDRESYGEVSWNLDQDHDPHTRVVTATLVERGLKEPRVLMSITQEAEYEPGEPLEIKFEFGLGSELATGQGNCAIASDTTQLTPAEDEKEIIPAPGGELSAPFFFPASSAVAATATNTPGEVLVAYTGTPAEGKGRLSVARIGVDGKMVGKPTVVRQTNRTMTRPTIARIGNSGYAIAWEEAASGAELLQGVGSQVWLTKLDANGMATGRFKNRETQVVEVRPMIIATSNTLMVSWMDSLEDGGIPSQPTDPLATVATFDPITLAEENGPLTRPGRFPSIAYDGVSVNMTWVTPDTLSIRSLMLTDTLAIGDEKQVYKSKVPTRPEDELVLAQVRSTATSGTFLSVWEDKSTGTEQVTAALMGSDQKVRSASTAHEPDMGSANWPSPVWADTMGAVAYYQIVGQGWWQLFLSRVSDTGKRIDGEDFALTAVDGKVRYPALVYLSTDANGDQHYGVAWLDDHLMGDVNQVYYRKVVCKKP